MRRANAIAARVLAALLLVGSPVAVRAGDTSEYRVKAGFVYNFIGFTDWPQGTGVKLPVCIYGTSAISDELSRLNGRATDERQLDLRLPDDIEGLTGCKVVFVAASAAASLRRIAIKLQAEPVLLIAENPGALTEGAMINLAIRESRVVFSVNLSAARRSGLGLSARMLQLATEVRE